MRWPLTLLPLLALGRLAAAEQGSDLSLSDLPAYRAALEEPSTRSGAAARAVAVTFRELWDHPARYQGQRVRVEGRVMRRFRQPAVGTFPPLAEVWAVSPAGDPFCLVFPVSSRSTNEPDVAPGASIRFEGTFLKQLRYQGSDTARLAPLIVGPHSPAITTPAPPAPTRKTATDPARSQLEWMFGLTIAAFAALILARRHLQPVPRPRRDPIRDNDPAPEFVDPAYDE